MVSEIAVGAPGVLGFAISGRLTRVEYESVLLPPIRERITAGQHIRVLALVEDFRGLEPGGLLDELKSVGKLGSSQKAIRSYFAVVTDADWLRRSVGLFGWLVPGEVRVFSTARRPEAEAWLAGAG